MFLDFEIYNQCLNCLFKCHSSYQKPTIPKIPFHSPPTPTTPVPSPAPSPASLNSTLRHQHENEFRTGN